MCSLCQILIRFFWSMFSWSSFSKKSPTLADYLFSLHFFESVIVGQILTLCWNPQLPVKFPFLLLHLHFLFVTTNKNTIFRGKSRIFGGYQEEITIFSCICLVNPHVLPVKSPSFLRWKQTMPRRWCRRRASRRPGSITGLVLLGKS